MLLKSIFDLSRSNVMKAKKYIIQFSVRAYGDITEVSVHNVCFCDNATKYIPEAKV